MSLTPSTMLALGTPAPDFSLPDAVSGQTIALDDFNGANAMVVMFICNHCPFVIHVRDEITRLSEDYARKGVAFVGVNSNDVDKYTEDSPANMKQLAEELGWEFPFLMDASQEVAKSYRAACTPDFFVFNAEMQLVYRGRLDESRPQSGIAVTGVELRAALDAVLEGKPINEEQVPSMGCNIKWRPGNEPDYFG